jgi:putative lipoic acid-binding regulatory protein
MKNPAKENMPTKDMSAKELTDSLIEYPSNFPIKVFGQQNAGFAQAVLEVVNKYDPGFIAASMEMRASKTARYVSLTCTIRATSRVQLDAIYQDLCDHPMVVMVL